MKIIKETSNLMVFKDWNIVTFFIGAFFCLLGLYLLFSSGLVKKESLSSLLSIVPFLLGLLSILKLRTTIVSFDKGINKLSLKRKRIINQRKEEEEYNLDEIKQIELQEQIGYGEIRQRYSYNIVLVLNDDQRISLPSSGTTVVMGRRINNDLEIGKRISEFLNIPFKK